MHTKKPEALSVARAILALHSGEAVRLRRQLGLSQALIATAVGCEPATVSRWESLDRCPSGQLAVKYARLLGELQSLTNDDGSGVAEPLVKESADATRDSSRA
jgi:DNA-binding transcriptional regulator YiaG